PGWRARSFGQPYAEPLLEVFAERSPVRQLRQRPPQVGEDEGRERLADESREHRAPFADDLRQRQLLLASDDHEREVEPHAVLGAVDRPRHARLTRGDALEGRAIEHDRSLGDRVDPVDERVERAIALQRADGPRDALAILEPHRANGTPRPY